MRATKINKVLKNILKLDSIPKEQEFEFKKRSQSLLDKWNKILAADAAAAPAAPTTTSTNGVNGTITSNGETKKEASEAPKESSAPAPKPEPGVAPTKDSSEASKESQKEAPKEEPKVDAPKTEASRVEEPKIEPAEPAAAEAPIDKPATEEVRENEHTPGQSDADCFLQATTA